MEQSKFMYDYNDKYREKFNPELFNRSDDDIIEELKKIILSCQRNKFFTIRVESFKVIEDYKQINDILYDYVESSINKNKPKKKDNIYDFINLKDSDIKLLVVRYFIKIKDEQEFINVLIAVPRIVDKFYFRLSGNVYSAMYQIVDASTYNNTTSNSKKHSITLKTMFMPIRLYRNYTGDNNTNKHLLTTTKESVKCTYYMSNIFSKSLPTAKYLLAKFGLNGALHFMHMSGAIIITDKDPNNDTLYTFHKYEGIYVSSPKCVFDNDNVVQSFVYTIVAKSMSKSTKFEDLFNPTFWADSLGNHFNNGGVEKGLSILDSLECVYDITTKTSIHLPAEAKADIYCILKWMMGEFSNLKIKNNLDISTKRIRCAEYIASLYAMKLSTGIYRVSDQGKKANLVSIRKAIMTRPTELLGSISKCQLVNYRNMVNDTDSLTALKYTYKGIAGIGEKGNNSVPSIYRSVDLSHLGRVDPDSSSATDPGITGTLCPLGTLHDMSFSEFEEPNSWDVGFAKIMTDYKALVGLKEVLYFKKQLNMDTDNQSDQVEDSVEIVKKLIKPLYKAESNVVVNGIKLEEGGMIYYE